MAGFQTKTFLQHDDYMTPFSAWDNIKNYIPKNKTIWEPFFGDGKSGKYLEQLGFKVIHKKIDFFENNEGDIVVSNPPFTKTKEVLERLIKLDKPFILILPAPKLFTQYFRKSFTNSETQLQLIVPRKRIQFVKLVDGKEPDVIEEKCNFDCFYYCYKIDLPKNIIWLE